MSGLLLGMVLSVCTCWFHCMIIIIIISSSSSSSQLKGHVTNYCN
jgi:hypothetical protein